MLYCIELFRDCREDDCVLHHEFENHPTREEVLQYILSKEIEYNDKYHKFDYYPVKGD